jgi:hypothetical protein
VGKAGIPKDATSVTVGICHAEACVEVELAIPPEKLSNSNGTDPAISATLERTADPFAPDLWGVFSFDATWSSATQRIAGGDYVVFKATGSDASNVLTVGHTVRGDEVPNECGCGQLELSH